MNKERVLPFAKFCVVGLINTAVSLLIYYLLLSFGINYIVSMAIGYILSSICGYFLNKIWVFKKKQDKITKSIFKYYILYISALFLNLFCMYVFVNLFNISDKIAPLITILITTIYNYLFSKFWVFKKSTNSLDFEAAKKDKVLIGLFMTFVVLVGAVLINNYFNHPVADDYSNYNSIIKALGTDQYTLPDVIGAIWNLGINTYQTWQGTYFANFLFYINPLLISTSAYKVAMLLIQLFWLCGTWYFFKSIPANDQKAKIRNLKLYLLFIIFSIMSMYSLGEGLYWFTGSILYIIPFTISLIFFGVVMRYLRFKKPLHAALSFILAIILGGTSYVTGLVVGFVILLLAIYSFIKKPKIASCSQPSL